MDIEIVHENSVRNLIPQIANIHSLAYSRDHFTSKFHINKLNEYYQRLVEASDLCVVAIDDNEVVGFIIAGKKISEGIDKFIEANRGWLLLQLLKRPNILFKKIFSILKIKIKNNSKKLSKADFRLLSIATKPDVQSKGVGHAMLIFFEQELVCRGVKSYGLSVKSNNGRSISFYERHGFLIENEFLGSSYYLKILEN